MDATFNGTQPVKNHIHRLEPGIGGLRLAFAQVGLVAAPCLGLVLACAAALLLNPRTAVTLAGLCGLAASSALTRMWRPAR